MSNQQVDDEQGPWVQDYLLRVIGEQHLTILGLEVANKTQTEEYWQQSKILDEVRAANEDLKARNEQLMQANAILEKAIEPKGKKS